MGCVYGQPDAKTAIYFRLSCYSWPISSYKLFVVNESAASPRVAFGGILVVVIVVVVVCVAG